MIFIVVIPSASSEPFAALEDKLREGAPAKKRKPRFFTSLRSVQNDKMAFSYAFLEWMGHSSSAIPDMYFTMNDRYAQAVMNTAERLKIGQF